MDPQEHKYPLNTRVRLKDIEPGMYGGYAAVGNEGWIKGRSKDAYGYPMVLIKWDKNHWAYSAGLPDVWTYENHFEPVEQPEEQLMEEPQPDPIAAFLEAMIPKETPRADADYDEKIVEALKFLKASDAYLVIGVDSKNMRPKVWRAAKNLPAGLIIDVLTSKMAAETHELLVTSFLEDMAEEE